MSIVEMWTSDAGYNIKGSDTFFPIYNVLDLFFFFFIIIVYDLSNLIRSILNTMNRYDYYDMRYNHRLYLCFQVSNFAVKSWRSVPLAPSVKKTGWMLCSFNLRKPSDIFKQINWIRLKTNAECNFKIEVETCSDPWSIF